MTNLNIKTDTSKDADNFTTIDSTISDSIMALALEVAEAMDRVVYDGSSIEDKIEQIEFVSRDGFSAYDSNRGGLTIRSFTTVGDLVGSGEHHGFNKSAIKEIERQYGYGLECALEAFCDANAEEIKGIPKDKLNYHDLYDLGRSDLAERLSEYEHENTYDDQSSIMLEVRIMYHGQDNWSVSAVVNTEGPYHRSHISWAPNIKCEHGKEVEIETKKIAKAVKKLAASELGLKIGA